MPTQRELETFIAAGQWNEQEQNYINWLYAELGGGAARAFLEEESIDNFSQQLQFFFMDSAYKQVCDRHGKPKTEEDEALRWDQAGRGIKDAYPKFFELWWK